MYLDVIRDPIFQLKIKFPRLYWTGASPCLLREELALSNGTNIMFLNIINLPVFI
jgi:hypothetical protein